MIRFYAPDIAQTRTLPESDSAHAARVLRMNAGDTLDAVDGRGNVYRCIIESAHPKHLTVNIVGVEPEPKTWQGCITVAIAPTKNNDRMEWLVEKLVEIGVDRIVPLRCARSERKDINTERLERVAVAAMKQSLKAIRPVIEPTVRMSDFLARPIPGQRFIAYCDPTIERRLMVREYEPGADCTILIGPEGDFSPEEIRAALDGGWRPVSLGDSRLRTETAALFAVAACHVIDQLKG